MATLEFSSKQLVFDSFLRPESQVVNKIYYEKNANLTIGTSIFSDKTLTNKLVAGKWYGLKNYKGSNWALKVNELSKIVEISENRALTIGFLPSYPFANIPKAKLELARAAAAGAEAAYITIELSNVFEDLAQFNANLPIRWVGYDEIMNSANGLYSAIYLRICTDYDDTLAYDLTANPVVPKTNPLFNLFTDIAQDEWGNPARIARGSGHGSFSKDTARAKMTGFVSMVLQRYAPILGSKLVGVSVGNAAQQEAGYNYENQFYDANGVLSVLKKAMFDYNPAAVYEFGTVFCKSIYGTLANANSAHNKNYTDWSSILPPKTGKTSLLSTTEEDIYSLFYSQLGLDWYKFRYAKIKAFWLECKAILAAYAPNAKFVIEAGSFTDPLTRLRGLFDIGDISTFADVLKAEFTNVDWSGNANISAAIVANNVGNKEIQVEVNENDPVTQAHITDPTLVKKTMFDTCKSAKANGASIIWIIADSNTTYFQNSMALIQEFKTWNTANPNYKASSGTVINIPISKFIQNYEAAHLDCILAGVNTGITDRPIIKLIKDI